MARFKWKKREDSSSSRPTVSDDFIYDDPADARSEKEAPSSDTPEDALRKFRSRSASAKVSSAESWLRVRRGNKSTGMYSSGTTGEAAENDGDGIPKTQESGPQETQAQEKPSVRHITSTGIELDENLQPIRSGKKKKKRHPLLRMASLVLITLVLVLSAAFYIFHRIIPDAPVLDAPENLIGRVVTPVQSFFSGLTESVASYFRTLKIRANIENEYNKLRAENEQLVYQAMLAEELQNTLRQYEDLSDEIAANAAMHPIVSAVIGKSDSNYFSTFTINKGSDDGVEEYMAVTINGSLVGYTESVRPTMSTVRTIIDSEASIAALIQSSRDQGTVRGTLGVDGTPMCRMYYLPDDNLPRPGDTVVTSGVGMSFPKGIPIGTVRESTRGMEANKQYIILEPLADFQHLEYVIVLLYKPVPEAIEGRENGRTSVKYVPTVSARPSPEVPQIASSLFESQTTQDPNTTPTPSPEPTESPSPTPTPTEIPTPTPEVNNLEYQVVLNNAEPTATPTPSPAPTPTPYLTPDPEMMTFEEDEE